MLTSIKLQRPIPVINCSRDHGGGRSSGSRLILRLPLRRFASLSLESNNALSTERPDSSHLTSTVGSSASIPLSQCILTQRHLNILNFIACGTAISAIWLFCSTIPTLLAFKRAAESLEKLLDVTREELPDTMAAVRLSGMEISDLTMELSDLGQEITQGVRNSTRAVRVAEEKLRHFTNMSQSASLQAITPVKNKMEGPGVTRTAKGIREGIMKGRAALQLFFAIIRYSRVAFNFLKSRAKA